MNPALVEVAGAGASELSGLRELLRRAAVEVQSGGIASGSGIIWGGGGLVVTNAHCAPRGAALRVNSGGNWRPARPLAYHPRHDLALLAVPSLSGPMLEQRDTESLRAGELLLAHGNPLGVRDALALGVFHALAREAQSGRPRWVIAAIRLAPGNSGGPLADAEGRLVGINSMVVNGLGVAIPAPLVQRFVEGALARRAA